jgi:hypothetical protein
MDFPEVPWLGAGGGSSASLAMQCIITPPSAGMQEMGRHSADVEQGTVLYTDADVMFLKAGSSPPLILEQAACTHSLLHQPATTTAVL